MARLALNALVNHNGKIQSLNQLVDAGLVKPVISDIFRSKTITKTGTDRTTRYFLDLPDNQGGWEIGEKAYHSVMQRLGLPKLETYSFSTKLNHTLRPYAMREIITEEVARAEARSISRLPDNKHSEVFVHLNNKLIAVYCQGNEVTPNHSSEI